MKNFIKRIAESLTGQHMVAYPVAFHTVDIAAVRENPSGKMEVLLIQKSAEVDQGWWRFPGGFIDPTDQSAEHAAMRELNEEVHLRPALSGFSYVGSRLIDDSRYRESPHKIITSFYSVRVPYDKKDPVPGDDAARARWFSADILGANSSVVNPIHLGLASMLATSSAVRAKTRQAVPSRPVPSKSAVEDLAEDKKQRLNGRRRKKRKSSTSTQKKNGESTTNFGGGGETAGPAAS